MNLRIILDGTQPDSALVRGVWRVRGGSGRDAGAQEEVKFQSPNTRTLRRMKRRAVRVLFWFWNVWGDSLRLDDDLRP